MAEVGCISVDSQMVRMPSWRPSEKDRRNESNSWDCRIARSLPGCVHAGPVLRLLKHDVDVDMDNDVTGMFDWILGMALAAGRVRAVSRVDSREDEPDYRSVSSPSCFQESSIWKASFVTLVVGASPTW